MRTLFKKAVMSWRLVLPVTVLIGVVYLVPVVVRARSNNFDNSRALTKRTARPGSPEAARRDAIGALFAEARSALLANDLTSAERKFRAVLQMSPRDPAAWYELGKIVERQGRVVEALVAYRKLVYPQPGWGSSLKGDAGFLTHFAELSEQNGRDEDAAFAWRGILDRGRPVRIGPWAPSVPRTASDASEVKAKALAIAAVGKLIKDSAKAAQLLDRSLSLLPNLPEAHFYVGYLLDRQKKYPEAKAEFDRALHLSGNDPAIVKGVEEMIRRTYWEYGVQPSYGGSLSIPDR